MKNKIFVSVFLSFLSLLAFWIVWNFVLTATTQTRYNRNLIEYSKNAHKSEHVIEAWRGKMFDRNGNELVSTRRSYDVFFQIKPYKNDNEEHRSWIKTSEISDVAKKVAKILDIDADDLEDKLRSKTKYQVEVGNEGKNLNISVKEKLDKINNPGIHYKLSTSRYYSEPSLGSLLFGYTNKDEDGNITGASGIEKYYNDILSGKEGKETYLTDSQGYKLPNSKMKVEKAVNPQDVYLTIDQHIQTILEKEINSGKERNNAEWVLGIITDSKTNKILGAGASPGFNLETLKGLELFNSPLANQTVEPGSVMKIFTWANAINNNRYNAQDTYMTGEIKVDDHIIKDHTEGGWGRINLDQAFYRSSNTGAITIARNSDVTNKKGYQSYIDFLKLLGFGKKTGIEIADEKQGQVPEYNSESDVATATFGQNILATPMQLMQAISSVSSPDHSVHAPRIVEKIQDSKTGDIKYKFNLEKNIKARNVLSDDAAKKVLDLMKNNVSGDDEFKTGTNFAIDGYSVGVKTGSAQIADEESKYSTEDSKMLLSGLSVAPVDNPKINVYIAMKRPKSGQWDIPTIYRPIVKDVLEYLGTSKENENRVNDKIKEVKKHQLPSLINMSRDEAKKFLDYYGLKYMILGDGEQVISQLPNSNETVYTNQTIILNTSNKKVVPDLSDKSLREVRSICQVLNIKVKLNGTGYVTSQSKEPGEELSAKDVLEVNLK